MKGKLRARTRLLVVLAVGLGLTGVAAAFFTGAGVGMSTASVGTIEPLTIEPATPTGQLYPGGSGDVVATISNPNGFVVHVGSLALDTSNGSDGFEVDDDHSGCDPTVLTFTRQTSGWDVPANGTLGLTLGDALSMNVAASASCQGAQFTVYLETGT